MKPTFDFDASLLDNQDKFSSEFYDRFTLRPAGNPLELNENVSKNYLFPTFYGEVTCAAGAFLCSYEKAQAMMLHPKIRPVSMGGGRAVVIFSCYIYRNVMGVPPYNEIAMTIPVLADPSFSVPVLPMLKSHLFKKFGYYVFSMPVTSLENEIRGHKIWGLPKVTQEIDIQKEDGDCVTTAFEQSGEQYFRLRTPMGGKATAMNVTSNLYSKLDGRLLQSETNFKGSFNITKYPKVLLKKGIQPSQEFLTIGDTPSGKVLKNLEIEPQPLQFQYADRMESCFDLPNPDFKPSFSL